MTRETHREIGIQCLRGEVGRDRAAERVWASRVGVYRIDIITLYSLHLRAPTFQSVSKTRLAAHLELFTVDHLVVEFHLSGFGDAHLIAGSPPGYDSHLQALQFRHYPFPGGLRSHRLSPCFGERFCPRRLFLRLGVGECSEGYCLSCPLWMGVGEREYEMN